jgi:hypothetical protein
MHHCHKCEQEFEPEDGCLCPVYRVLMERLDITYAAVLEIDTEDRSIAEERVYEYLREKYDVPREGLRLFSLNMVERNKRGQWRSL